MNHVLGSLNKTLLAEGSIGPSPVQPQNYKINNYGLILVDHILIIPDVQGHVVQTAALHTSIFRIFQGSIPCCQKWRSFEECSTKIYADELQVLIFK